MSGPIVFRSAIVSACRSGLGFERFPATIGEVERRLRRVDLGLHGERDRWLAAVQRWIVERPRQLPARIGVLEARVAALRALAGPAGALYRVLTPAQRRTADALMTGPRGMM